jgi:RimJ/RimL family protein N-acetyltransferase
MTEADLPLKVKWYNDPEIRQTLILDEVLELEKTKQWFEAVRDAASRLDLMIETEASLPIGQISLVNIDARHQTAEIVLVIGEKTYWGKGVMLEAESLLIGWAFETLGLRKIWAQTRPENIASLITMKKLGFQIEGTLRSAKIIAGQRIDILHLGLLPEDFKPAKLSL